MAFLFARNRQRSGSDLCRSTKDLLLKLEANKDERLTPRFEEDLARNLGQMKLTLQGTVEAEVSQQQVYTLVHQLMAEEVLLPLAKNIHRLPFETRKDAQIIFSSLFRYRPQGSNNPEPPFLQYAVNQRPDIIIALCNGYDHKESAMPCGGVLREAMKHDSVSALILYDEPTENGKSRGLGGVDPNVRSTGRGIFWKFFEWIDKGAFEVSADAFSTFREILTKHKKLVAHYLLVNYDLFVQTYNEVLMKSSSYVTKRQSINLLAALLLERTNYSLMTHYVESADNLKLCMNLLKDDRRMINYEGFHIFKVFVANPSKSQAVMRILINNRDKLLRFLPGFLEDRKDDVQFEDEKAYLVRMIQQLPSAAQQAAQQQAAQQQVQPGQQQSSSASQQYKSIKWLPYPTYRLSDDENERTKAEMKRRRQLNE